MTLRNLKKDFPQFLKRAKQIGVENLLETRVPQEIESKCGCPLPESYKRFLLSCGGMWLHGGAIQFGSQHPFKHDFPPIGELNTAQIKVVKQRGGVWPPPSDGMLCFAEYFLEADGDQVLFKTDDGLVNGEYPVYYYAHSASPARAELIAESFWEWLEKQCLQSFEKD